MKLNVKRNFIIPILTICLIFIFSINLQLSFSINGFSKSHSIIFNCINDRNISMAINNPISMTKFSPFVNRIMEINGMYPSNWIKNDYYDNSMGIFHTYFYPPNSSNGVDIFFRAGGGESLSAYVGDNINSLSNYYSNFNISKLTTITLKSGQAYCINYTYSIKDANTKTTSNYIGLDIYTKLGDYEYGISYSLIPSQFFKYLNLFSDLIDSINFTYSDFSQAIKAPTIKLGNSPNSFGYNPNTNLLYVSNTGSDTVSVLNTKNNSIVGNIKVGSRPTDIVVNPISNSIYTSNIGSDTISVIDGLTNNVTSEIRAKFRSYCNRSIYRYYFCITCCK